MSEHNVPQLPETITAPDGARMRSTPLPVDVLNPATIDSQQRHGGGGNPKAADTEYVLHPSHGEVAKPPPEKEPPTPTYDFAHMVVPPDHIFINPGHTAKGLALQNRMQSEAQAMRSELRAAAQEDEAAQQAAESEGMPTHTPDSEAYAADTLRVQLDQITVPTIIASGEKVLLTDYPGELPDKKIMASLVDTGRLITTIEELYDQLPADEKGKQQLELQKRHVMEKMKQLAGQAEVTNQQPPAEGKEADQVDVVSSNLDRLLNMFVAELRTINTPLHTIPGLFKNLNYDFIKMYAETVRGSNPSVNESVINGIEQVIHALPQLEGIQQFDRLKLMAREYGEYRKKINEVVNQKRRESLKDPHAPEIDYFEPPLLELATGA